MKKENKAIKDKTTRDNRNLFEYKEEDYSKPVRVSYIWSNRYIEYGSNDRNKALSVEKISL